MYGNVLYQANELAIVSMFFSDKNILKYDEL